MLLIVQSLISGILIGGLYSIIAVGVTLNWGIMRVINLAHFSLSFLAAYLTYQFSIATGWDPFFSLVLTIPAFFVLGAALQWFFEKFEIAHFTSLLVTFGIFVILESIMREIWTADLRTLPIENVPYRTASLWIGSLALRIPHLGAFITAVVVSIATWLWLNRTYDGKALRALSQDRPVAGAFGINHRRLALMLGGISGVYAAIAGAFIAVIFVLRPDGATEFIGLIFAVVILGGLGNTAGAFGAGIIVGVAQSLTSATIGPGFSPLVTFSLLILVLLFRPQGLFVRRTS
ncbi:MAG: branched-chain amino acid ABC transporter permease [Anaerolineae bacterium]|nr:branched-chain amino acid ABC transporter permease [Anaerolineae bacterium]MCA9907674.1 branched-chain amino acid ABC transporter permease [Anaerolineae bacterium]